jgi:hypothetical protein
VSGLNHDNLSVLGKRQTMCRVVQIVVGPPGGLKARSNHLGHSYSQAKAAVSRLACSCLYWRLPVFALEFQLGAACTN